ncbi:MAG: flagellar basal body rod protein FlgC [Alphaproteobacteria bacterium]|nr:flagellar basal body rod protein FlgC [Alphaproteobacteria bacterium]MCK5658279.1 flagellar basal body rod protein FlgC [Alphaproteobacteria bacterium]
MDLLDAMAQAAQGMKAQGVRMRVISENLANAKTTGTEEGEDPYQRKIVTFKNILDKTSGRKQVEVDKILPDQSNFIMKYDPNHPAADKNGYVKMPNVNTLLEMMDMREAQRSYEANLGVIDIAKGMLMRTLDMLSR